MSERNTPYSNLSKKSIKEPIHREKTNLPVQELDCDPSLFEEAGYKQ